MPEETLKNCSSADSIPCILFINQGTKSNFAQKTLHLQSWKVHTVHKG